MDLSSIIVECVQTKCKWQNLSPNIRANFNNDENKYRELVIKHSISNQLSHKSNLVGSFVQKEEVYYQDVINYSCANLMVYPYHLQEKTVHLLSSTPFNYYIDMISDQVMKEKSYDCLPNFTAADCLQILAIGRNQYIDIMMKNRTNKSWPLLKKSVRSMLPQKAKMWECWEPWWIVHSGAVMVSDVDNCTRDEKTVIDLLIEKKGVISGNLNRDVVLSLYVKDLVYFDIPIHDEDYFVVPKLENFVMNRILGDYLETTMYKVLVSLDENISLTELAIFLDLDLPLVKLAASVLCRLGLIYKKNNKIDRNSMNISWIEYFKQFKDLSNPFIKNAISSLTANRADSPLYSYVFDALRTDEIQPDAGAKRMGFVYDSSLTAFLMVGNLSQELKTYAMTMFEVGKLTHELMPDFMGKLSEISQQNEGEARTYYLNALNLLSTLRFLRRETSESAQILPVDMIHNESLKSLSRSAVLKLFNKRYSCLICMAPLSNAVPPIGCSEPPFFGPPISEFNSFWYRLFIYHVLKNGPPSILLPHGYYLPVLPKIFMGFELLYVSTPDQTPSILAVNNCIHILNETLKHSYAFIQGFSTHSNSSDKLFYLSFPIDKSLIELNSNEQFGQLLENMSEKLNLLNGFGYLSLLKMEKNPSNNKDQLLPELTSIDDANLADDASDFRSFSDNVHKPFILDEINIINAHSVKDITASNTKWAPFEVAYGIPLFNDKLNREICEKIQNNCILQPDSIKMYINKNRLLVLELIDFIREFYGVALDESLSLSSTKTENLYLYRPTKPIVFYGGETHTWTIHNEL